MTVGIRSGKRDTQPYKDLSGSIWNLIHLPGLTLEPVLCFKSFKEDVSMLRSQLTLSDRYLFENPANGFWCLI
jgi:hypothetical protein